MKLFGRRLSRILLVLLLVGAVVVLLDWWLCVGPDAVARSHYVGRGACIDCHAEEDALWVGSDHDRAMALATEETVLGNFDNQTVKHFGVRSRMFRRGAKFMVETDGPDGKMTEFEVKYTFGVRPLQQYLVEFPDGRVQCLPLAWDTEKHEWYHLYPKEAIPHNDFMHWTGPFQNWNFMCAHCHSTNLEKNFELATNSYRTTFSEINVSCETCHGPGSLHVELAEAKSLFWDRRVGFGLPNLKSDDPRVEIETCAPCHAHQRIIYPGFKPGDHYLDHYVPSLLDGELYYADGQILEEDYVYGSFIQSRMYREKVRCSDCHDPHSCTVKKKRKQDLSRDKKSDVNRIKNNELCCQCHMAATYDTPKHHFHDPKKSLEGTLCIECHMAEQTYMGVDPRRDHSLRVPRPDLTVSMGIPNACNNEACHDPAKGETAEWSVEHIKKWYGPKKKEPRHFAHAIAAGRQFKPEGEQLLVEAARRKDLSGMVRASVLVLLGRYLTNDRCDAWAMIREGLEDSDGLVRLASARALSEIAAARAEGNMPQDEADRLLLDERLLRLLSDPLRAVRFEAARIVSAVPRAQISPKYRKAFDTAIDEFIDGHRAVADRPMSYTAIGDIRRNQGNLDLAEKQYNKALKIDPDFVPARSHLALIYYGRGQKKEAEAQYRRIIKSEQGRISRFAPALPGIYYSLGLLVAEDQARSKEAAELLAKAVELAPANPRMRRNLGWLYEQMGQSDKAERELLAAHRLAPSWAQGLHTLGFFYLKHGQPKKALMCAERWLRLYPEHPQAKAFLFEARRAAAASVEKPNTENPEHGIQGK